MLTVIFDFQDVESMSTTSVTRGNINRPSHITTRSLRNTFRKTHESSWKPIKTTSLKPGDGITLMRIFYLSGKIPEKHRFIEIKSITIFGKCLWIKRNVLHHFSFYLYSVQISNFAT
jgi:hypothetical protein